jgi:hypothetical protein
MKIESHVVDKTLVDEMLINSLDPIHSNGWKMVVGKTMVGSEFVYRVDIVVFMSTNSDSDQMIPICIVRDKLYDVLEEAIIDTYFNAISIFGNRVMSDVFVYSENEKYSIDLVSILETIDFPSNDEPRTIH